MYITIIHIEHTEYNIQQTLDNEQFTLHYMQ